VNNKTNKVWKDSYIQWEKRRSVPSSVGETRVINAIWPNSLIFQMFLWLIYVTANSKGDKIKISIVVKL
jgi:hypothetical protein